MSKIYTYKKITDEFTTHTLFEPYQEDEVGTRIIELCTIDGRTYVFVPDGVSLPKQKKIIAQSLKEVTLDTKLKAKIIEKSSYLQLTKKRMEGKTTKVRYSKHDENQLRAMEMFFDPVELNAHVGLYREWQFIPRISP